MKIRPYWSGDCPKLAELFYETVHTINVKDYTEVQLNVWAPKTVDLDSWNRSLGEHHTLVAEIEGEIAGFADMDETGYLDRLYVHKDYQHRGIAAALCDALEDASYASRFTTHASITARPFFESRGYCIIREQQVERQGIQLTNYIMEKRNRSRKEK